MLMKQPNKCQLYAIPGTTSSELAMPITLAQKLAIEETIHALLNVTSIRSKRPVKLAAMFMDLVDRTEWPAYYDVR